MLRSLFLESIDKSDRKRFLSVLLLIKSLVVIGGILLEFRVTAKIENEDRNEIFSELLKYNRQNIDASSPKDLGIYLEDSQGKKLAGLIGESRDNWLTIKYLWVAEGLRGQQIGSEILMQAEETARERGCKFAFLDTFDFQAPIFYEKHGYKEVFILDNYPLTGKRFYFVKELL